MLFLPDGKFTQIRETLRALVQPGKTTAATPPTLTEEWAVVVSADATTPATLTLKIGGSAASTSGIAYLSTYSPTAGDTVVGLKNGTDLLILGKKHA